MQKVTLVFFATFVLISGPVLAQTSGQGAGSGMSTVAPKSTVISGENGVNVKSLKSATSKKAATIRAAPPGAVGSGVANQSSATTPSVAAQ